MFCSAQREAGIAAIQNSINQAGGLHHGTALLVREVANSVRGMCDILDGSHRFGAVQLYVKAYKQAEEAAKEQGVDPHDKRCTGTDLCKVCTPLRFVRCAGH